MILGRGFRLREITLTSSNTGQLAREGIRKFNKHVKKTVQRLRGRMRGWGAIGVDEVGLSTQICMRMFSSTAPI